MSREYADSDDEVNDGNDGNLASDNEAEADDVNDDQVATASPPSKEYSANITTPPSQAVASIDPSAFAAINDQLGNLARNVNVNSTMLQQILTELKKLNGMIAMVLDANQNTN